METPNYMTAYWEQVIEDSERRLAYAREQLARLALKQVEKGGEDADHTTMPELP